ncbi:hypothetical protein AwMethylo_14680 [Methylobacterium sp.]|nr:hypothetical protein AwMethylo_14680 [Methylobacterium sp.]
MPASSSAQPVRHRLVPLDNMAFELGQHLPALRATPQAAALILLAAHYRPDDIAAGIEAAMAKADTVAAAAASEANWALRLGRARDAAAIATILVAGSYLWAWVA